MHLFHVGTACISTVCHSAHGFFLSSQLRCMSLAWLNQAQLCDCIDHSPKRVLPEIAGIDESAGRISKLQVHPNFSLRVSAP